ncbi:hypothetical protein MKX01_031172 [Papaver californicum]|nr:hypothetical protein MKX01_031172 [Papaver californicum]
MKRKSCGTEEEEEEKKQEVICYAEVLYFEILTRLPVKSLMRFKCVSRRWQSLIHEDRLFIDYLHSSRLNQRPSLLLVGKSQYKSKLRCLLTAELLITSTEDGQDDRVVSVGATSQWIAPPFRREHHICTLNGLICIMDTDCYRACVYNSTTRESTPWIKSVIKQQVVEEQAIYQPLNLRLLKHEFGYDPVTKEQKVVALWSSHRRNRLTDVKTVDVICEVLTVRQNSWRKIDVVFPGKSPNRVVTSVYMSGSIYWHCKFSYTTPARRRILAESYFIEFDVGREKFRLVDTPPHIISDRFCMSNLIEADGRLARLLGNKEQVTPGNKTYF